MGNSDTVPVVEPCQQYIPGCGQLLGMGVVEYCIFYAKRNTCYKNVHFLYCFALQVMAASVVTGLRWSIAQLTIQRDDLSELIGGGEAAWF